MVTWTECALQTTEERLLSHLFSNHNKLVVPILNRSQPIEVTFGIELNQILKIDDRSQLIHTKVWVRQTWTNHLIKWNASQWDDIDFLMVDPGDVWTPDMVLYDSTDTGVAGGPNIYKTQIAMYPNGVHRWLSPAIFTSSCNINIKYFPFDHQVCSMKFGSWSYDASKIKAKKDTRDVVSPLYIPSAEWEIKKVDNVENLVYYACCANAFSDVTIRFHLRRKPSFYVFNVIVPCLVLALTILFGFFFPPQSGERIGLIITILLAMAVFIQIISDTLPVNSDETPKLSLFYMVILIECAASLATTCCVLVFHYKGVEGDSKPMPRWAQRIFIDGLANKLGFLDKQNVTANDVKEVYENQISTENGTGDQEKNINEEKKNEISDKQKEVNRNWILLGKVFDFIFFILFFMTLAISAISIIIPAYLHGGED